VFTPIPIISQSLLLVWYINQISRSPDFKDHQIYHFTLVVPFVSYHTVLFENYHEIEDHQMVSGHNACSVFKNVCLKVVLLLVIFHLFTFSVCRYITQYHRTTYFQGDKILRIVKK